MYYLNTFFLFSILGHLVENFFYTSVDSGILYGYWTPVYGLGVIIILLIYKILKKLKLNKYIIPLFLFVSSAIILSAIEYMGGIIIEFSFGRVFWDYSSYKFNIGKYIALEMAVIWGIASIFVIYIIKPILDKFIKKIPKFITFILVFLFIIDLIITFVNFAKFLI